MNSNAREKLLKSWSGVNEVALIKEVATKGEFVELCIEFLAKKRKLPVSEYKLIFHDVVHTYVCRLLNEKLVCKAEDVLRNVLRNVKCFYFQFSFECQDEETKEIILDHLKKKDPQGFAEDLQEFKFFWNFLQELKSIPVLREKVNEYLRRVNLETFLSQTEAYRKSIMAEVYFVNRNSAILWHLNKYAIWDHLIETQNTSEITRWCILSSRSPDDYSSSGLSELDQKYFQWKIEDVMFDYGLKKLERPDEILRNEFSAHGYFFTDERLEVQKVLRRICTKQSFVKNKETIEKLPMGKFLLERKYYSLLLQEFVSPHDVQELIDTSSDDRSLLELIFALKTEDLQQRDGFKNIFFKTKAYLEKTDSNFERNNPLIELFEFLSNEPTISELNSSFVSSSLTRLPYLVALAKRCDNSSTTLTAIPSPYDFLRKFKNLNFKEICKETGDADNSEPASFSNARLCKRYSRKYHLNFLHYLKQQRSSYAVYYFFTDLLQNYSQITKAQLFSATETVTELALHNSANDELVSHCVAFNEMLGFDTQNLRIFMKLSKMITGRAACNFDDLIARVEDNLLDRLDADNNNFPLPEYQAVMRIASCYQYRTWPQVIFSKFAEQNDWWRVILLLQYFNVPLEQVKRVVKVFRNRIIGEHLLRALSYDPPAEKPPKRRPSLSRQQKVRKFENQLSATSAETMNSSMSSSNDPNFMFKSMTANQLRFLQDSTNDIDIFAIILLSSTSMLEEKIASCSKFFEIIQDSHSYATSINLMKNCIKFNLPVLSMLAATVTSLNVDWNWIVWLAVATRHWSDFVVIASRSVKDLSWSLIEKCVRSGHIGLLHRSLCIFYKDNPLAHLSGFLHQTCCEYKFGEDVVNELRLYLLAWSNDEIILPLNGSVSRDRIMFLTTKLLIIHLKENFNSSYDQYKAIATIWQSGIDDISNVIDFGLLKEIFKILLPSRRIGINFENLLNKDNTEYEGVLSALLDAKDHDNAIRIANLLNLPICDIVYMKWVAGIDAGSSHDVSFQQYEDEIQEHSLPPEILVNFFLYAASRIAIPTARKYMMLKRSLDVIKKNHLFPNESFDRDQIEYEMIVCYLQIEDMSEVRKLDIYHSVYYEEIMQHERCVLYKSFLELKELAGIEDLTINAKVNMTEDMRTRLTSLLNCLLDKGDIVEALRLQELFQCRPIDLRFVVFCMALAEGVTTIFSMSLEERQMLSDVEKKSFVKFNKRTLGMRTSVNQSGQGQGSPLKQSDLSDSCSTLGFEEIPSKEKRETLDTIQGIASKLKYGIDIGKRIVLAYRAAMYLDKEYLDVLRTKDTSILLKSAAEDDCLQKLLVVSDILTSTQMNPMEIADLLALEITTAVIRPRFYLFGADQQAKKQFRNAELWGYNIDSDLHLFLELTPNTTMLGNCLLEYCDALKIYRKYQDNRPYQNTEVFENLAKIIRRYGHPSADSISTASAPAQVLSHKKQNLIYVELLIKAHQCFVHECSMEGIADVLNRAKALNVVLTTANSWSLIVRMLIGIARYREMFYCFDSLIRNEQFESLLGQFDEEKAVGLRQAILSYLREYCPDGKEYYKLAALHFLMYKELAEIWEKDAKIVIDKIIATAGVLHPAQPSSSNSKTIIPKLKVSPEILTMLNEVLENYTHATENYLLDNKLRLALKSSSMAELVAMQIDLANKMPGQICVSLLNLQTRDEFKELVNSDLRVPQSLILSRAYDYDINWPEAILCQYVLLERKSYLTEYLIQLKLTDAMIENIVKGYQLYSQNHSGSVQMEQNLCHLVDYVKSVTLKYRLASLLSLKSTVMSLINEQTSYYLKDTNYGRSEMHLPDI